MGNIILADLKRAKAHRNKNSSVRAKHVRDSNGRRVRVLSLDANSATFIEDLTTVFEKNVARARRENKRLLGSANGRRAKA